MGSAIERQDEYRCALVQSYRDVVAVTVNKLMRAIDTLTVATNPISGCWQR